MFLLKIDPHREKDKNDNNGVVSPKDIPIYIRLKFIEHASEVTCLARGVTADLSAQSIQFPLFCVSDLLILKNFPRIQDCCDSQSAGLIYVCSMHMLTESFTPACP